MWSNSVYSKTNFDLNDDEYVKLYIINERTQTGCTLYEAVLKLLHTFEDKVSTKLNEKEKHKFFVHVYERLGLTFEV